jgi:hypothetical protein
MYYILSSVSNDAFLVLRSHLKRRNEVESNREEAEERSREERSLDRVVIEPRGGRV